MSDQSSAQAKTAILNFEQKIINRSITDLLVFDGLADYLLECCSAEARANTLSFFSLLPLVLTSIFVGGPSRLWFLLAGISLFFHQILDIANKKQAYRLQTFSFGTYYFDHMCDSFSCMSIVYIMGTLLEIPLNWLWLCIFLFGMLPFYMHHLAMYYGEYMSFPLISPASEGLLVLELICLVGVISPTAFQHSLGPFCVVTLIMALALVWLVIFLIADIREIARNAHKFNELSIKNIFVIFVLGYLMFETATIKPELLATSALNFGLFYYSMALCFTILIGELVLAYGTNQNFQQISINTLLLTALLAVGYAICALGGLQGNALTATGTVLGVLLAVLETVYYGWRGRQIMSLINDAINNY